MPVGPPRSPPDPEKNDPKTDERPLLARVLGWMSPSLKHKTNTAKNDHKSFWGRVFARILSRNVGTRNSGTPVAIEVPDMDLWSPPEEPAYSEAESRQASAKLWSIYIGEAERYDKALVESWKADMEGMLIFSGLFSASLTAFLIESYQTLQPDSGALTVQLLTQISQQLAVPSTNTSLASVASAEFQPATSSLVCNTLWFISLTLSITCALLATLVEQWAREFLHRTEKHPSPIRRARVFSFLYFGVRRFGMHVVVDLIPLLLHVALILFLAGLIAFLVPINQFMMGLIGASLAIFMAVYAVMTFLPIISSDCPYRTPFSGFVWRSIQEARKWWLGSVSPPTGSNLNDIMLDTALQNSARRDQRALSWTLESLTDDQELLPFLEAIPEAIHGPNGFYLQNDHIFISLLNGAHHQESLGTRIKNFIQGSRNMNTEDPMRHRRLLAGMKAIWALAMISGRTGDLFERGEKFWFEHTALLAPDRKDPHWPHHLTSSGALAILYSQVNDLRTRITRLAQLTERDQYPDLCAGVDSFLSHKAVWAPSFHLPQIFRSYLAALRHWSSSMTSSQDISTPREILSHMTKEEFWIRTNAGLLGLFLARAALQIWEGKELPYEYLKTCIIILPHIPPPPETISITLSPLGPSTSCVDLPVFTRYFDSSAYDAQISNLDRIMACFLRIFPFLELGNVMPLFTLYLVKRKYADPVHFATEDCNLRYLYKCFVRMLHLTDETDDILRAIEATLSCGLLRRALPDHDWQEQDDQIYDFMDVNGLFGSPRFLCLSAIIKARKLSHVAGWAPLLLHLINVDHVPPHVPLEKYANWVDFPFVYCQDRMPAALREWRVLIEHPLLRSSCYPDTVPKDPTAENLIADIRARANRSLVISFIDFILSCIEARDQPYLLDTMSNLCRCVTLASFDTLDSDTVFAYAKARLTLVQHLIDEPQNMELDSIAECIFSEEGLGGQYFPYYQIATPIFKEATTGYLKFIKEDTQPTDLPHSRDTDMEEIVNVLTAELQQLGELTRR